MHIMGSLNMRFTWVVTPTAGSTVKVSVVSDYNTPDDWVAESETVVNGNTLSVSMSLGDFLPKGNYWEILVYNNTDEDLELYGKMVLYRIG